MALEAEVEWVVEALRVELDDLVRVGVGFGVGFGVRVGVGVRVRVGVKVRVRVWVRVSLVGSPLR